MKFRRLILFALFLAALNTEAQKNITYAETADGPQQLDLYLPANAQGTVPLIIWIHGGGWKNGSKENCLPVRLGVTERGYAVASINYRLTGTVPFPAQIEDCKAAVRWLRVHAGRYGLNPDRFGVWGSSAGGHLVALLGTSGDVSAFDVGKNLDVSSRVQAVCDFYGPSDFTTMGTVSGFERHARADSPESALLGGTAQEKPETAKAASPVTYATPDDPPFLIMHGDRDGTVPLDQSRRMDAALRTAGVESELIILPGAGHGGPAFSTPETTGRVASFFDRHLK
ncbi:MAG: alpha/beta hydrolase [Kiritimatiellaceae bacterium]|nr:alpha/beta hydrolase [Kiritimatiellaceae bacterium]